MPPTQTERRARRTTSSALPRLVIENLSPSVDDGRYPAKRVLGEICTIGADIFKDGHDTLAARVRYRSPGDAKWRTTPLLYESDDDRWVGLVALDELGTWEFTVEAWTDEFATWRGGLDKKLAAGQDVRIELVQGAELIERAAATVGLTRKAKDDLRAWSARLRDEGSPIEERGRQALDQALLLLMAEHAPTRDLTGYGKAMPLVVERPRAACAAWYEFFPRSASAEPGRHGTFRDAEAMLPRIAELGFDVVYLPPIHPIGRTFRKGRNNTLTPEPDDVGSPWAIGNEDGGHDAVDPNLGTIEDFERFVRRAGELGLDVALDYALQCSPDHPWVREHPEWFHIRPDGTIQYAENPPKKYQDIYPLNFWTEDREGLWNACRDLLLFWIARGVKTFRVDNPHTKPFAFWEWAIAEVRRRHPDVVFLSEAFTRPKKLLNLAKLGFSQSYGYFTWKNVKWELRDWISEFWRPEVLEYHRGNLFANTPDILTEYLQAGGQPAFRVRLLLAATLSPVYGIYSGFELYENLPAKPRSEEYLDSEKYQLRTRDYGRPGSLDPDIRRLNAIRRTQPALQRQENLELLETENDALFAYLRAAPTAADDHLIIVANLDPDRAQFGRVRIPFWTLGLTDRDPYEVEDLLTGGRYWWRGDWNPIRLDPREEPGHVFRVRVARAPWGGEAA